MNKYIKGALSGGGIVAGVVVLFGSAMIGLGFVVRGMPGNVSEGVSSWGDIGTGLLIWVITAAVVGALYQIDDGEKKPEVYCDGCSKGLSVKDVWGFVVKGDKKFDFCSESCRVRFDFLP